MSYSNPSKPLILVSITGEVGEPGFYNVQKGKTVENALNMAGILETSDLSKIDLQGVVEGPRKLVVKAKREKRVKSGNKR